MPAPSSRPCCSTPTGQLADARRHRPGPGLHAHQCRGRPDPRRHAAPARARARPAGTALLVRDLTFNGGGAAAGIGMLEIITPGIARVEGALLMTNARRRQRHRLDRAPAARGGDAGRRASASATAAGAPGGTLLLASNNIWIASQAIIDQLRARPRLCRARRRPARQWRHRGAARLCRGGGVDARRPAAPCSSRIAGAAVQPGRFRRRHRRRRRAHRPVAGAAGRWSPPSAGGSTPTAASPPATPSSSRSTSSRPARRSPPATRPARRFNTCIIVTGQCPAPAAARYRPERPRSDHRADRRLGRDPAARRGRGGRSRRYQLRQRSADRGAGDQRRRIDPVGTATTTRTAIAMTRTIKAHRPRRPWRSRPPPRRRRSRSASGRASASAPAAPRSAPPSRSSRTRPSATCSTAPMRSSAATPRCRSAGSTCCALRGGDPAARLAALRAEQATLRGRARPRRSRGWARSRRWTAGSTTATSPIASICGAAAATLYVAEGLAGYDSALRLGLRSLVADREVDGEVSIATTGAGDPAAFARAQAGTLDPAAGARRGLSPQQCRRLCRGVRILRRSGPARRRARPAAPSRWSTRRCRSPISAAMARRTRCSPAPPRWPAPIR